MNDILLSTSNLKNISEGVAFTSTQKFQAVMYRITSPRISLVGNHLPWSVKLTYLEVGWTPSVPNFDAITDSLPTLLSFVSKSFFWCLIPHIYWLHQINLYFATILQSETLPSCLLSKSAKHFFPPHLKITIIYFSPSSTTSSVRNTFAISSISSTSDSGRKFENNAIRFYMMLRRQTWTRRRKQTTILPNQGWIT